MVKVGFVSLGCNKNLVDSEIMMGACKEAGFEITPNAEDADVIVINTCGFINDAKQESIDTILEMAEYKNKKCKFLIVTGCLTQRYKDEILKEMPEIDAILGVKEMLKLPEVIKKLYEGEGKLQVFDNKATFVYTSSTPRIIATPKYYAYIKIAEGCNNRCSYCSIPLIRGDYVSRYMDDIIKEAEKLAKGGYKEIVLTAQDTTKYGLDIYKRKMLPILLQRLSEIDNIKWIRFLYSYPEDIDDELLNVIKDLPKVVKYFDIPIQHINNRILKLMNRRTSSENIKELIKRIRSAFDEVVIRTTVMVGFPTESEDEFEELYEFVKWAKFDRLGAFMYSQEEGTPAASLPQIDDETKVERYERILNLQRKISLEQNRKRIGKKYEVVIEGRDKNNFYIARSQFEAPEVDGKIIAFSKRKLLPGEYVTVKILDAFEYDLVGEVI
ncbi:30S ribosomal protein S12 methylthiotransferase RimO [Caldicellulosiruptor naganoensis]|uniref:Ribosomal protein uS12 methylthiotransferase RimO n=1 Tax=Caldicellulosiruptor naganoensis TaxID=29324 RepID=A0ABY7BJN6_9FIRM|nr:30S ribosomal protein S12 methylthiotransferase RimO [Caldicellulosiruptor naganoensis]WAM32557.1 30S ribosomal protein S12 methylthiotransferase RimO [Caldicellulosiruptor naganoensis]